MKKNLLIIHISMFEEGSAPLQMKRVTTYPVWFYITNNQTILIIQTISIFQNKSNVLYFALIFRFRLCVNFPPVWTIHKWISNQGWKTAGYWRIIEESCCRKRYKFAFKLVWVMKGYSTRILRGVLVTISKHYNHERNGLLILNDEKITLGI